MKEFLIVLIVGLVVLVAIAIAVTVIKKVPRLKEKSGDRNEMWGTIKETVKGSGTVLLIIAGGIVCWIGIYNPSLGNPSLVDVANQSRSQWFWVLVFAGILAILIARIGKAQKTLYWILVVVLCIVLFVPMPLLRWTTGTETLRVAQHGSQAVEIPLASAPQAKWPKITIPAGGKTELIPIPPNMHSVVYGGKAHYVYTDGRDCASGSSCPDGSLAGMYIANEGKEKIIVSYAFAE
jgi:hypothetical protein